MSAKKKKPNVAEAFNERQLQLPLMAGSRTSSSFDLETAIWIARLLPDSLRWTREQALTIAESSMPKSATDAFSRARMTVALDRSQTLAGVAGGLNARGNVYRELAFVKDFCRFLHHLRRKPQ